MRQKVAILGSTGSIGKSLLNIIRKDKKNFEIILLTANNNYKKLIKQSEEFKVKNVILTDKKKFNILKKLLKNKNIKVFNNFDDFDTIFKKKIDYTMSSIVGLEGLNPIIKIIPFTKNIAIANKEPIVCAWDLIKKKLNKHKTRFVPVDSEHFSIWFGTQSNKSEIEKIFITASGGPFLNYPKNKFSKIQLKQALDHPNWRMGKKISIDSATMMNKIFEVIEAKNIFDLEYKKLSILIHPKSYVHALIKFKNGLIKIIAHETNMEIPIANTLYKNKSKIFFNKAINIGYLNNLSFRDVDLKIFPVVKILKLLPSKTSLFETIIVSANDELVNLFLQRKIKFVDISKKLLKLLKSNEILKYKKIKYKSVKDIIKLAEDVRFKIRSKSI